MKQAVTWGKEEPKDAKDQVYVGKCQRESWRQKMVACVRGLSDGEPLPCPPLSHCIGRHSLSAS